MASKEKIKFVWPGQEIADKSREITWPCVISEPMDGGEVRKLALDVRFKVIDQDESLALYAKGGSLALYDDVVLDFPSFADASGAKVDVGVAKPFFRSKPYAVNGIIEGFSEMLAGRLPKN